MSPCNSERARAMQRERSTRALRVTQGSVLCERAAQPCVWARAPNAVQEPLSSEPMQHLLRGVAFVGGLCLFVVSSLEVKQGGPLALMSCVTPRWSTSHI